MTLGAEGGFYRLPIRWRVLSFVRKILLAAIVDPGHILRLALRNSPVGWKRSLLLVQCGYWAPESTCVHLTTSYRLADARHRRGQYQDDGVSHLWKDHTGCCNCYPLQTCMATLPENILQTAARGGEAIIGQGFTSMVSLWKLRRRLRVQILPTTMSCL